MPRRDEVHRRERHEIQLQFHLTPDVVPLLHGNVIPLVHGEDQRASTLKCKTEHARILLADLLMRIDHVDDDMRMLDRLQRLRDADALDHIVDLRAAANPRGVDQEEIALVPPERHENAVSRGARLIARNHALLTEELDPGLFPRPRSRDRTSARIEQFLRVLRDGLAEAPRSRPRPGPAGSRGAR